MQLSTAATSNDALRKVESFQKATVLVRANIQKVSKSFHTGGDVQFVAPCHLLQVINCEGLKYINCHWNKPGRRF